VPDFRFQSSWADDTTKLSWVVTRWYAPSMGTFISEDSLLGEPADPDSRHLYAYAQGDPVGAWDPDGRAYKPGAQQWRRTHYSTVDVSDFFIGGVTKIFALGCIIVSAPASGPLGALLIGSGCMAIQEAVMYGYNKVVDQHEMRRYRIWVYSSTAGYSVKEQMELGVKFVREDIDGNRSDRTIWSGTPVLRTEWRFETYGRWRWCYLANGFRMASNCLTDSYRRERWNDKGGDYRRHEGDLWPLYRQPQGPR
jgi:RHS repeat-associated protein